MRDRIREPDESTGDLRVEDIRTTFANVPEDRLDVLLPRVNDFF
jgi:hypothetical protein